MNISIILAAGEGTRMNSNLPKVLHKVCGKPIIDYVINSTLNTKIEKNILIVGHGADEIKEHLDGKDIIYKEQPIYDGAPYGTGYAVIQAIEEINDNGIVTILCGDTPLITENTINKLINYHETGEFHGTVLSAILDDPTGYGRIVRKPSGDILKIVEQRDTNEEELKLKEINSGMYCFKGSALKYALNKIDNNNSQNEYYLTDVISILNSEGYKMGACLIDDSIEIHGVNSRIELAFSEEKMRLRINKDLMLSGVTIINPLDTYIEHGVKVGRDTIIYPGVTLQGETEIGVNCILRANTRIINSKICDMVDIESSLIESSLVEDNCKIGPYAHLRPESHLGKNVKIGNFVEIKKSHLHENTKAGHLAYIGDAEVGSNVNIGCGVIVVNYNGLGKSKTIIGDNAFIGSNTNLIAPVEIKDWAYVAAGSTITKEVEEGSLSISRAPQKNIPGWVERKGLKNHKTK